MPEEAKQRAREIRKIFPGIGLDILYKQAISAAKQGCRTTVYAVLLELKARGEVDTSKKILEQIDPDDQLFFKNLLRTARI